MANLKEVARKAGVSIATASLALNGKYVNEETRKRVLACARELDYVPNRGGRTLITGKSNTILMVIINSNRYPDLIEKSTFFYHFMQEILTIANRRNYNFHFDVINWEDARLVDFFHKKVHDKSNDGMIVIPQYRREYPFFPFLRNFPTVMLNPWPETTGVSSVRVDHGLGASIAAHHIIDRGYERIAVIHGPDDHCDGYARKASFLAAMTKAGIGIPAEFQFESDFTTQSGYDGAREILSSGSLPDAIFCANDYVAAGAMRYMHEHGLAVPRDIALVGYDDTDVAEAVYPRITTVGGVLKEVGQALGTLLFDVMDGKVPTDASIDISPRLIERDSCPPKRFSI